MRRREFITFLGGATAWPLTAWAQQQKRVRRVGVLIGTTENDPETKRRVEALRMGFRENGWIESANLQMDFRSAVAIPSGWHPTPEKSSNCIQT